MFDLTPFQRRQNDVFDFFNEMQRQLMHNFKMDGQSTFRTDITDQGNQYVLEAELPGFNKEDIDIEVENNQLTIRAQHQISTEENKNNYIRRERQYGSFVRSFDVSNIDSENIQAEYQNGILTLVLPKKNPSESQRKRIDIH